MLKETSISAKRSTYPHTLRIVLAKNIAICSSTWHRQTMPCDGLCCTYASFMADVRLDIVNFYDAILNKFACKDFSRVPCMQMQWPKGLELRTQIWNITNVNHGWR